MLLAIDVGNTNTVIGAWDGVAWLGTWRRATRWDETEDELGVWVRSVLASLESDAKVTGVIMASVVPALNRSYALLSERWFGTRAIFLTDCEALKLNVRYDPPRAVGADRLANALGALALKKPPLIVVDFGTATTFDAVDSRGDYVGGAILPGVAISGQALVERTAKLPQIEFLKPERAVGRTTVESLQSGIMFGYAGAVDALVGKFRLELRTDALAIATGGNGAAFVELCETVGSYEPNLTLDGLVIAHSRLAT